MAGHHIYSIRNTVSGKRYIGRSRDVVRRWKEHAWSGKRSPICQAIRKYGVDAFDFEVIAETDVDRVVDLEAWYINLYDCVAPRGYNLIDRGDGNCGHHPATCAKISAAHKGKVLSDETRAKMSVSRTGALNPNFGQTMSEATRASIRENRQPPVRAVTEYDLRGVLVCHHPSMISAADGDRGMAEQIGRVCSAAR